MRLQQQQQLMWLDWNGMKVDTLTADSAACRQHSYCNKSVSHCDAYLRELNSLSHIFARSQWSEQMQETGLNHITGLSLPSAHPSVMFCISSDGSSSSSSGSSRRSSSGSGSSSTAAAAAAVAVAAGAVAAAAAAAANVIKSQMCV